MQMLGTGVSAGAGIANSYMQSSAMRMQGDYANRMAGVNAGMTDLQSEDAIWRGEEEAKRLGIQTRQLIGAQRASAAAQGVSVNSGSPMQLQMDAASLSAMDQATIRNNAYKEAMGLKMQSDIYRTQGAMARRTGRYNANATMLSGVTNALGSVGRASYDYYRYTPPMRVPDSQEYFPDRPG